MYQRLDQAGASWVGLRSDFASINVGGDFIHASRHSSRVRALRVHVSRAGHSARFVVLPDSTRGTIISNKSPTVDVLSAFLAAYQRKKAQRSRLVVSLPFDEKTMRIARSLTRFVHEREKKYFRKSTCTSMMSPHVVSIVTYFIECYNITLLFVMYVV